MTMDETVINIYLLNKLLGTLDSLFLPDNPFRLKLEREIRNQLDDLGRDTPE